MWNRLLPLLVSGARLVLGAALVAVIASAALRALDFSHAGDYGEGPVLAMVERLRSESISAGWLDRPPYTLSCYGPGYYWAVASAATVLPWDQTLLPGRLVSLMATLATAALLGLAIGRSSRSMELGMTAALVYLASPIVRAWGTPHRVDPLATLFAVGAYLALTAPRGGLTASAACVVVGSLVKPTVALAAIPIFCWLLLRKRFKEAAAYVLLVAGPGAAAWAVLDWASGGYFFATAVRGNLGTIFPGQGFWAGHAFLSAPLGVAAGLLVAYRLVRHPILAVGSLWCVGFGFSTLMAAALSTKEGAAANYFLEASALGTLVIGFCGLGPLWSRRPQRALALVAVLALILAAPDVRLVRERGLHLDLDPFGSPLVSEKLAAADGGGVLADGQLLPAVLHAGLVPLVNDPFVFRLLAEHGRIDASPLVDAMRRGEVGYLVLKQTVETHRRHVGRTSQKWPAELLDAMQQDYALLAAGDDVYIYRHLGPRPPGG